MEETLKEYEHRLDKQMRENNLKLAVLNNNYHKLEQEQEQIRINQLKNRRENINELHSLLLKQLYENEINVEIMTGPTDTIINDKKEKHNISAKSRAYNYIGDLEDNKHNLVKSIIADIKKENNNSNDITLCLYMTEIVEGVLSANFQPVMILKIRYDVIKN